MGGKHLKEPSAIWNATAFEYDRNISLHQRIAEQADQHGEKIAIRYGAETVSYREMNEKANQLAKVLIGAGISKGDRVGLLVNRSPRMIISLLAILKAGAAYVPLDPEYPKQRISYMLSNAGAVLLLTEKKYRGHIVSPARELLLEDAFANAHHLNAADPGLAIDGSDLAYVIYTSGSTGKPKGVMVEHHSVMNLLLHLQNIGIINSEDRLLAITTISFDIAVLELFLPLITGAQIVLTDATVSRDGFALLELIRTEKISIMQATPVTWKIMLAAGWEEKADMTILCCGEALPIDLAKKLVPRCNRLFNYYGPTETTIYSAGTQINAEDKTITIGGPVANTQLYILDENRQSLGVGEEGELYIGGEGVSRGYKDLPQATSEHFVNDPFAAAPGKKMFRTGDLGKWTDDGKIYLLGRIDQQVKIRGFRIEPGEIEALLRSEQDIRDAVVIAREDTPDNKMLVAYIVPERFDMDATNAIQQWKRSMQAALPDFMIPLEYVIMPGLPVTPNGKINRKELPKPGKRSQMHLSGHNSETEKMVAAIWADALEIEEVGLDENFFDLGGHSLIAVQIMARLEKETGKRLPIAALFEAPTVRKLSDYLQSGNITAFWEALVPIKPGGSRPPLYIVHGDGLNVMVFNSIPKYMDPDQPVIGLQPKGLNGIDQPDESMEEIAAYYISGILKENPEGPYFLAGYSFGGIVAFEMAKQLKRDGHEVKLLAMFDTNVGNIEHSGTAGKRFWQRLRLQLPKMMFIANSFSKYPASVIDYQWFVVKRKWHQLMMRLGLAKERESDKISPHEKHLIEKHLAAYQQYALTAYDGKIDLFRVKKRVYFVDDPVYLGWKSLAKDGVFIHEVPGDHRTFLLPPNDKAFAHTLQSVIDDRSRSR